MDCTVERFGSEATTTSVVSNKRSHYCLNLWFCCNVGAVGTGLVIHHETSFCFGTNCLRFWSFNLCFVFGPHLKTLTLNVSQAHFLQFNCSLWDRNIEACDPSVSSSACSSGPAAICPSTFVQTQPAHFHAEDWSTAFVNAYYSNTPSSSSNVKYCAHTHTHTQNREVLKAAFCPLRRICWFWA